MGNRYDEDPEQAEAQIQRGNKAVGNLDDAVIDAETRAEALKREVDDAETPEEQAEALQRFEANEREIENLKAELASEEHSLQSTIDFWMEER